MTNMKIRAANPVPKGLMIFVALFMSSCSVAAYRSGNNEFVMYSLVMLFFIAILVYLHRSIGFTLAALWLLTIWGFMHMIGGTIPIPERFVDPGGSAVLYSMRLHPDLPRYDQITHAFGFFSATVACWEMARIALGATRSLALSVVAALMGMGLGAINEVVEFIATLLVETNVGGYTNTGWDLVSNSIGAGGAAVWCLNRNITQSAPLVESPISEQSR